MKRSAEPASKPARSAARRAVFLLMTFCAGVSHAEFGCESAPQQHYPQSTGSPVCVENGCMYENTGNVYGIDPSTLQLEYIYDPTGESCGVSVGSTCQDPEPQCGSQTDPGICEIVRQTWHSRCAADEIASVLQDAQVAGGETCSEEPVCDSTTYLCAQVIAAWRTRCETELQLSALGGSVDGVSDGISSLTSNVGELSESVNAANVNLADLVVASEELLASVQALESSGSQLPEGYLDSLDNAGWQSELDKIGIEPGESLFDEVSYDVTELLVPYTPDSCIADYPMNINLGGVSLDASIPFSQYCDLFTVLGGLIHLSAALLAFRITASG